MSPHFRLILILFLGIGSAGLFSKYVQIGHLNFQNHKFKRVHQIFEDSTFYDVLYLGSSRTHTTIYPSVVDAVTGGKSYNAGTEGGNLYEFKTTLKGYLVHHPPPKLVVLTLDVQSFDITNKLFFPLQYFESLHNPALSNALEQTQEYNLFFLKSMPPARIIYFDDYAKNQALKGLFGGNEISENNAFEDHGYLSNGYECIVDTTKKMIPFSPKFATEGKRCLKEVIDICRRANIQLIFTYAPEYRHELQRQTEGYDKFIQLVDSLRGGIPFYRDDNLAMCNDPCYFANYSHVNTRGAIEYSKILGRRLKGFLIVSDK